MFLRAAPIDVSHIINEMLFNRMRATIMTSATLTVDGSFDYVKGRLGVHEADAVRVPSEFDFSRAGDPVSAEADAAAEVAAVRRRGGARSRATCCMRTEGRAFVLFTSYAMLRTVRDLVEPDLPYPVIVQGTAPRSTLLAQFRSTPNAVLFATSSFWQGVDVVGEQLSCVIIDKLPFASPGDPITAARIEAINAEGGDAFQDYQVPLAILAHAAGTGPPDPPPHRPRRPGRARSAAADDGLRPPVPRLVSARPGDPESGGDHAIFRKLIYTDSSDPPEGGRYDIEVRFQ